MTALRVELPGLRLVSEANQRGSWHRGAGRAARQRSVVALRLRRMKPIAPPCEVRVIRIAPRALDDDNLARACKAVRDEVARWLGVDDGDTRVSWRVGQVRGRSYGVRVLVRAWRVDTACARVCDEGELTRVDLVLDANERARLAANLTGPSPEVSVAVEGLHLTVHTARTP